MLQPTPARAGYYWMAPSSRTGSVTVTPNGGSPTTTSLDDSDGSWSSDYSNYLMGSISYSYSATLEYFWIPDYPGDTPTSQNLTLYGSSDINFQSTSAALFNSETSTASVTMLGSTHSRTGTNTANYPSWPTTGVSGTQYASHSQSYTLSGDSGSLSFSISASLNAGANGVFLGFLAISAPMYTLPEFVVIKSPASGDTFASGVPFTVSGKAFIPPPGDTYDLGMYWRVAIYADHGGVDYLKGTSQTYTAYSLGSWSKDITISDPGDTWIWAVLQRKKKDGTWEDFWTSNIVYLDIW